MLTTGGLTYCISSVTIGFNISIGLEPLQTYSVLDDNTFPSSSNFIVCLYLQSFPNALLPVIKPPTKARVHIIIETLTILITL